VGYEDPSFVEYDIDPDDEAWLASFNGDQVRLSETKLETMLWKLDVANAAATDRIFSFQGAPPAERHTEHACAATDHLQRDEALQMLEETCPSHKTIRVAVYEYWLLKRKKLGRPLLRRLQAPTALNDKDPYRVFRSVGLPPIFMHALNNAGRSCTSTRRWPPSITRSLAGSTTLEKFCTTCHSSSLRCKTCNHCLHAGRASASIDPRRVAGERIMSTLWRNST